MPFDPRIVHADEELRDHRELELPDDLAILGAQLGDDAQRLAACYPAPALPSEVVLAAAPAPRIGRRWLLVASTIAAAAALGLLVAAAFQPAAEHGLSPPARIADTRNTPQSPRLADHPAEASPSALPGDLLSPASYSGGTLEISPAVLRHGITSPEMEAWMDLRQNDLAMDAESIEF